MTDSTNPRVMADNIQKLYKMVLANTSLLVANTSLLEKLSTITEEEFDTGKKIDGRSVYGQFIKLASSINVPNDSFSSLTTPVFPDGDYPLIIQGGVPESSGTPLIGYFSGEGESRKLYIKTPNNTGVSPVKNIYIEYLKLVTPTPDVTPSPDPDTRSLEEPETEPEPEPIEEKK